MPLPTTRKQIAKLGQRLAASDEASEEDLQALEELIACHMTAAELGRARLADLADTAGVPLHMTHRAKTTKTIVEKLRREHNMSLSTVQDLAGIRVVGAFSYDDQDRLGQEVISRFPADPRPAKVIDRRANPSYGYRALHVVVTLDGVSIEVQIRTALQHIWADLMERLADRLGRQIRYGGVPVAPPGMPQEAAQAIVDSMMAVSEQWAAGGPPVPGDVALHLDRVTEEVWGNFRQALGNIQGVDL